MKKKRLWKVPLGYSFFKLLMIMKFSVLILCLSVLSAFASESYSQTTKLSLSMKNTSIDDVLKRIEDQSEFRFFYTDDIDTKEKISIDSKNTNIQNILNEIFEKTSIDYKIVGRQVALFSKNDGFAFQNKEIKGIVVSESGEAIPGVTILIKGTTIGTITNIDGNFVLKEVSENAILVFSFIGMAPQEILVEGQSSLKVVMKEDNIGIDEIVVVGYGVQKKKLVTGATSQVNGSDIGKMKTISVIDVLKSNTSGVQIVKKSGQPGDGFNINIRGLGTTGDASPLFIVDGIPVSNIDFLNPSDIEFIDILKDAASSAIYGSRAANGVMLITTKKGKFESKPTITYDGYYGVQNLYKKVPTLNALEYATMMNEARINDKLDLYDFASIIPNWEDIESGESNGTDWLNEITVGDAPIQNHSFGINGGTKSSIYSIGLSYTSQEGILGKPVASSYERYNFRVNTEHIIIKRNDKDILKIGENIVYSYTNKSGISIGDMYNNSIRNILSASPLLPLYDENGDYHYAIDAWDVREANPVGIMDYKSHNVSKNYMLIGTVYVELQPVSGLIVRSSFGYNHSSGTYRNYIPEYKLSERSFKNESEINHSMSVGSGYIFENTVNYNLKFNEDHKLNLLAGNTIQKDNIGETISGTNVNGIFDDLEHAYLSNAEKIDAKNTKLSSYPWGENMLLSYFGRINYDFKEKYMLTLVMRTDGSSKFAKGKRWGYFPSIATGWIASSEPFFKRTEKWLDFLKVRASWGQNGNQNISSFQYLSSISFNASHYGIDKTNRLVGAYPSILPNTDITWETSEQINIGIDSKFLINRLSFNFDWYKKTTKDWLVRAPALASYGTTSPYINGGDVKNTGVELSFKWRDKIGDLNYYIGTNVSYNKNEIIKIANSEKIIHGPTNVLADLTSEMFRAEEGKPIGYFWGYRTDGIFQNEEEVLAYKNSEGELIQPDATPGDVRFVNTNGDNKIDDKDKVQIGNPNPDLIFGINIGVDYKGFDISVSANGVCGNQIIRSYRDFGIYPRHNYTTEIFGRWHGEGTSNKLPKLSTLSSLNSTNISDLYIEDGDYLRISNISLGYDFKAAYKSLPVDKLRMYLSVQNLYTFTNYSGMDPEIGYNGGVSFGSGIDLGYYPTPRTVMLGLEIIF